MNCFKSATKFSIASMLIIFATALSAQIQPANNPASWPVTDSPIIPVPPSADQTLAIRLEAFFCLPLDANPEGLESKLRNDGEGNLELLLSRGRVPGPCPLLPITRDEIVAIGALEEGEYNLTAFEFQSIESFPNDTDGFDTSFQLTFNVGPPAQAVPTLRWWGIGGLILLVLVTTIRSRNQRIMGS